MSSGLEQKKLRKLCRLTYLSKKKEKQKKLIVLPYYNYKTEKFAVRQINLVNDNFDQVDLKLASKLLS